MAEKNKHSLWPFANLKSYSTQQTGEPSVLRLIHMKRQFLAVVGLLLAAAPSFAED
jgi:hypothetical protein